MFYIEYIKMKQNEFKAKQKSHKSIKWPKTKEIEEKRLAVTNRKSWVPGARTVVAIWEHFCAARVLQFVISQCDREIICIMTALWKFICNSAGSCACVGMFVLVAACVWACTYVCFIFVHQSLDALAENLSINHQPVAWPFLITVWTWLHLYGIDSNINQNIEIDKWIKGL